MIGFRVSRSEIEKLLVRNEAEEFYGTFGPLFLQTHNQNGPPDPPQTPDFPGFMILDIMKVRVFRRSRNGTDHPRMQNRWDYMYSFWDSWFHNVLLNPLEP